MAYNKEVDEYISTAPSPKREIMTELRKLIHESVPGVMEEFKWSRPIFKAQKDFAYFVATKNTVNLGFYTTEGFGDPDGILEGTGKSMRHVKLRDLPDIKHEIFKGWLRAASAVK